MSRFFVHAIVLTAFGVCLHGQDIDGPPSVPLPYTTTMLRTHRFRSTEFLSIAEQLSVRSLNITGVGYEEAYYIFPGVPFSMRDPNNTIVSGIRAVFQHTEASIEVFYYLTSVEGIEQCVRHSKTAVDRSDQPIYVGASSIRGGITTDGWVTTNKTQGGNSTTYYVSELRGDPAASGQGDPVHYPFRIVVVDPPGGPEYGYVLDHGQHFPVAVDGWFNTANCPPLPPVATSDGTNTRGTPSYVVSNPWRVAEFFA
eukprot:m.46690 g.46690  ORF g.46690 m.46690 type:complete len:255 (-) comp20308_c0_seq1:49-813(-)